MPTSIRRRILVLCLTASSLTFMAAGQVFAQTTSTPTTYNINLALASQSTDSQGRHILTMQATGDLPGVLTIAVSTAVDGTITGGEWSLVVSYTTPLNPNAQPNPSLPDPDEPIGEKLVQKGVLSGSVVSGSATLSGTTVGALTSVQLVVESGTVNYANVSGGSGSAAGSALTDRTNSSGSMTLSF